MSSLLLFLLAFPALSLSLSCPQGRELGPNDPVPPSQKCERESSAYCVKAILDVVKDGKPLIKHVYDCDDDGCTENSVEDKKCKDVTDNPKVQEMFRLMNVTGKATLCCSKDGKFD